MNLVTVRLTFLAHSVPMTPTSQGLSWFECDGLGGDELLIRFFLTHGLGICLILFPVNGLYYYKFSLHMINVARITVSRSIFIAY